MPQFIPGHHCCCDPGCPASLSNLSDCYSITIPTNTTGDDVCNFLDGTHVLTRGTDPAANARLEEIYTFGYPSEFRTPCNVWVSPIYETSGAGGISQVAWVLELMGFDAALSSWRLWTRYNLTVNPPENAWTSTGETVGSAWEKDVFSGGSPHVNPGSVFHPGGGGGHPNRDCPQIPATITITAIECPAESPSLMMASSEPCTGCDQRKAAMNSIVPGSGDLVERITTATGLKQWWENRA